VPPSGAVSVSVPVLGGVWSVDRDSQPPSDVGVAVDFPACPPEDSCTIYFKAAGVKASVVGDTVRAPGKTVGAGGEPLSAEGAVKSYFL
jgi:hypothetical protein